MDKQDNWGINGNQKTIVYVIVALILINAPIFLVSYFGLKVGIDNSIAITVFGGNVGLLLQGIWLAITLHRGWWHS